MGGRKTWRPRPARLEETPSGGRRIWGDRRAHADRRQRRRRADRSETHRCGQRRHLERHGRWCLRHDRDLRGSGCTWRHGCYSPDDNAGRVAAETRSSLRDRTIRRVKQIGRRRWKKESGYHRQARAENAFFRYKSIIGDRLRARLSQAQDAEALIACNILNRMTELGRPASFAIGRSDRVVGDSLHCSGVYAPTPRRDCRDVDDPPHQHLQPFRSPASQPADRQPFMPKTLGKRPF